MNAEEFVTIFKKEKDSLLNDYINSQGTMVSKLISDLKLNKKQKNIIEKIVNEILTDAFYTILLGLDGSANIGGVQQIYKIYDENENLISDCGDIEAATYEFFLGK